MTTESVLPLSPDAEMFYRVDDFTDPWTASESILFVHGYAESGEAWYAWVPHFARRFRVVRIDLRGFGRSTPMPPDFPWSLTVLADDLIAAIRELAPEGVHLVAAKSAGPMAIRTASTRPDLVKSLTLIGVPVVGPQELRWREDLVRQGALAWANATMDARLGPGMPSAAKTWWIDLSSRSAVSTMQGYIKFLPSIDVTGDLPRISCPTLVMSTDTQRFPFAEIAAWQPKIPDSELLLIPGDAFHAAAAYPDECADAAARFIGRVTKA